MDDYKIIITVSGSDKVGIVSRISTKHSSSVSFSPWLKLYSLLYTLMLINCYNVYVKYVVG